MRLGSFPRGLMLATLFLAICICFWAYFPSKQSLVFQHIEGKNKRCPTLDNLNRSSSSFTSLNATNRLVIEEISSHNGVHQLRVDALCDRCMTEQTTEYKCLIPSLQEGQQAEFSSLPYSALSSLLNSREAFELLPRNLTGGGNPWMGRHFNRLISVENALTFSSTCGKLIILPQRLGSENEDTGFFDCVDFRRAKVPTKISNGDNSEFCELPNHSERGSRARMFFYLQPSNFSTVAHKAISKTVVEAYMGIGAGFYKCKDCSQEFLSNTVALIRSGDIMGVKPHGRYGQPPLDFYVKSIRHSKARKVIVMSQDWLNPVTKGLQNYAWMSDGGSHVDIEILIGEPFDKVLNRAYCAETVIIGHTTFVDHLGYSHNLKSLYVSPRFDKELASVMLPELKVYQYRAEDGNYTVFQNWVNSEYQREEMLTYANMVLLK